MTTTVTSRFVIVCLFCAFFASILQAQFTSSAQGTVLDQTGSIVPEVRLALTQVETGVTIETASNAAGIFRFPDMPPGKYKLRATKTGFQTVIRENIVLESGRVQSVSITLPLGAVSQEVTVTGALSALETSNAKISTVVTADYVQNFPLGLRNIYNVMQMAPGVTGFGMGGDSFTTISGAGATANGMRMLSNGYYVDGAPVNDMADGGGAKLLPNPDSVEEVRVSTNDYSSQWGKNAGILTQVVSKTGTNDYHGTLYWFHRDNILTSRTFLQSTVNPALGRAFPAYRRNDAGGSFGGPIRKEKTFFFMTFDELRSSRGFANVVTVETPQFADFMKTRYPNNVSTNLLTNFRPAPGVSTFQAGSVRTVSQLAPGCTGTNSLGMPCDLPVVGNAVYSDANKHDGRQWNARLDQHFHNGNDRLYGNVYRTTILDETKNTRPAFSVLGRDPASDPATAWYISVNYTKVVSAAIVNEMSSSLVREVQGGPCNNCRVPTITIAGMTGFGNGWSPGIFITRDINWQDVLSINRGKHFFKTGFNYSVDQEPLQFTAPLTRPNFNFLSVFDFAADNPISEGNINFDPRSGSTKIDNERDFRLPYYAFFVQDDWKARRNLTVNLGLRWEFNRNPVDLADKLANIKLGAGATLPERVATMTIQPVKGLYDSVPKHYFAPRLGIAWDPQGNGKISIRAGFGIFYDTFLTKSTFDRMQLNPPNFAAGSTRSDDPTSPKPIFALGTTDTSPYGFVLPGARAGLNPAGGPIGVRAQVAGTAGTSQLPYTVNGFTGIQYALTPKWILEANYSFSHGVHLWSVIDRNRCAGCGTARLNPYFATLEYHDNAASSIYHGGTFLVRRRFGAGLGMEMAYTIGKTIDLMSGGGGIGGAGSVNSSTNPVFDGYDLRAQRGLSTNDYPQRLSWSYLYELPSPKSSNALLKGLLGGWQTSGVLLLQSGRPYSVLVTNRDYNNDTAFVDKPDAPSQQFGGWGRSDYIKGTFKASDFPAPSPGREGNLGRNVYRGPGFANLDFSLIKNTRIPWFTHERAQMQLRGEVFNLTNRVNINNWDTNLANTTFGTATSARDPRTIQLGMRIVY
jgi:hypothetical protein